MNEYIRFDHCFDPHHRWWIERRAKNKKEEIKTMKKGEGKVLYSGKVETRKTMGVEITGVFLFPPEGRDQSKKIESDDKNKKGKNYEN